MLNTIITGPQKSVSSGRCIGPSRTWILYRATLMSLHKHRKSHFQTPVTCIVSKHSWEGGGQSVIRSATRGWAQQSLGKQGELCSIPQGAIPWGKAELLRQKRRGASCLWVWSCPLLRLVAARRYSFPNKPEANASQGWDWENSLLEYKYLYSFKFQRSL